MVWVHNATLLHGKGHATGSVCKAALECMRFTRGFGNGVSPPPKKKARKTAKSPQGQKIKPRACGTCEPANLRQR